MNKFLAFSVFVFVSSVFGVGCTTACVDDTGHYAASCGAGTPDGPQPNGMSMYIDNDGDLYGAGSPVSVCPSGTRCVLMAGDCNDSSFSVHPGAAETCNGVDDNCNGQIDEGNVCGGGGGNPTPTPGNEVCGNGRDDNGNGQIDEGCNGGPSVSDMEVRVVGELPPNVPNFTRVKIWNPYIHAGNVAPSGCEVSLNARTFACSWRQGRLQVFSVQIEYELASSITYRDQQLQTANPPQTRIWACTQGDWNSIFDTFGSTAVYVDNVLVGSAANGVLSGALTMVDNSRGPQPGSDGPACNNGCNFSASGGYVVPRNSCTH